MPNLLFFAPCEKVIVDQNNTASIVSILEELKVQTVAGSSIPPDSLIPMQWAILTLWEQASTWEMGRSFEQRISLLTESGNLLLDSVNEFKFEKPRHRVIAQIVGMPISDPGIRKIRISIREKADSPKEWKEVSIYSFTIELIQPPPANAIH